MRCGHFLCSNTLKHTNNTQIMHIYTRCTHTHTHFIIIVITIIIADWVCVIFSSIAGAFSPETGWLRLSCICRRNANRNDITMFVRN